jgi:hypothetical protein
MFSAKYLTYFYHITVNIMNLSGKAMFEVKNMYYINDEKNVQKGYVINHIPPIISTVGFGSVLFGEDPGNIIDDISHDDQVEKLTR